MPDLIARLHKALPQTQCTRCGYPDCEGYARAIAGAKADINQCPPGGEEGVARLAALVGRAPLPLNPSNGQESPRMVAFIDEAWCIGCTLCLKACPTDAIMGSNKQMHTVIESECTGCELCIPVCPVDCIELENASGTQTGWSAWSAAQAENALKRYQTHQSRLKREAQRQEAKLQNQATEKLKDLAKHSRIEDPAVLERKRKLIEAALEKARRQRAKALEPVTQDVQDAAKLR